MRPRHQHDEIGRGFCQLCFGTEARNQIRLAPSQQQGSGEQFARTGVARLTRGQGFKRRRRAIVIAAGKAQHRVKLHRRRHLARGQSATLQQAAGECRVIAARGQHGLQIEYPRIIGRNLCQPANRPQHCPVAPAIAKRRRVFGPYVGIMRINGQRRLEPHQRLCWPMRIAHHQRAHQQCRRVTGAKFQRTVCRFECGEMFAATKPQPSNRNPQIRIIGRKHARCVKPATRFGQRALRQRRIGLGQQDSHRRIAQRGWVWRSRVALPRTARQCQDQSGQRRTSFTPANHTA